MSRTFHKISRLLAVPEIGSKTGEAVAARSKLGHFTSFCNLMLSGGGQVFPEEKTKKQKTNI